MKASILFVDDDTNLLHGLERLLRHQRNHWDMQFVDGGTKALALMAQRSFDVVVSDMRMPELDGASLLSEVEKLYPGTVRVILSGYAEEKSLLRSIGPAHQYLSKPCEAEHIIALMERTLRLQNILKDEKLRSLTASLRNLPSPPAMFLRLSEAIDSLNSTSHQIAAIISEDVAMTAELLKITNSSYFSFTSHVSSVEQAVRLLGLNTIRALALHAGIFRLYSGSAAGAEGICLLNDYSLAISALARKIATRDHAPEHVVMQAECAGILSVIGMLLLLDNQPERYLSLCATASAGTLQETEKQHFHAGHNELGAYLLGLWGFADPVIEAVLLQETPSASPGPECSPLTYLHLARALGQPIPLLGLRPYAQRLPLDDVYVERHALSGLIDAASQSFSENVP